MQNQMFFTDFDVLSREMISKRIRENNAYCEVLLSAYPTTFIRSKNPVGIVLSIGPKITYRKSELNINEVLVFRQHFIRLQRPK